MTVIIKRFAANQIREALGDTRVVVIQGARQVGKSTLAQQIVGFRDRYVTLDEPSELAAAEADTHSYVEQARNGCLVIDEVQRVPGLIVAIKAAVDRDSRPGQFLLTGSANLLRLSTTRDSLAGRAESIELFGLSQGEIEGKCEGLLDRLFAGDLRENFTSDLTRTDYLDRVCAGGYPEALSREPRRRQRWFDEYVRRITERDAPDISNLRRLSELPMILRLLATFNASVVKSSTLSSLSGIPERTLPPYLDLLETMYLTQRVPAWSPNLSRRIARTPKTALLDAGLSARLINVSGTSLGSSLNPQPAGMLMEAFVMSELRKQLSWSDIDARMFHYRDHDGPEVDIVLESSGGQLVGIEVKASATLGSDDFRWLARLRDQFHSRFVSGVVLYAGSKAHKFGDRLVGLPLAALWKS